jgi:hypothetical protein
MPSLLLSLAASNLRAPQLLSSSEATGTLLYDAFISYSHAQDRPIAAAQPPALFAHLVVHEVM